MSLAHRLTELLQQHGPKLLREQQKLLGLAKTWPERERFLLKVAYRSRVVERLLISGDEAIQRQAYKNLTEEFALSPEAAEDIILALSMALNHTPPPRLAPRKFRLPQLPPLFTLRSGRLLARLALAAVLIALLGLALGWLLRQTGDSPTAPALREAQQQQNQLQNKIKQAKDDANNRRQALQAELDQLKSASNMPAPQPILLK